MLALACSSPVPWLEVVTMKKYKVNKTFPAGGKTYRRGQVISEADMVTSHKGKSPVPWNNTAALIKSGMLLPVYEVKERGVKGNGVSEQD